MRVCRKLRAFTLVEIMTVIALMMFLILLAWPGFFRARELSRQRSCQENQQKIDGGKQAWAMENNMPADAEPTWAELVGPASYIRKQPKCPGSGVYSIGPVSENPACSLSTQDPFPHEFENKPPGG